VLLVTEVLVRRESPFMALWSTSFGRTSIVCTWPSGVTVRALDSQVKGRGFDSFHF